jgi:hypothetical protein
LRLAEPFILHGREADIDEERLGLLCNRLGQLRKKCAKNQSGGGSCLCWGLGM